MNTNNNGYKARKKRFISEILFLCFVVIIGGHFLYEPFSIILPACPVESCNRAYRLWLYFIPLLVFSCGNLIASVIQVVWGMIKYSEYFMLDVKIHIFYLTLTVASFFAFVGWFVHLWKVCY